MYIQQEWTDLIIHYLFLSMGSAAKLIFFRAW